MTNLVLFGLAIFLNISITLFILHKYTVDITEEISKVNDCVLEVITITIDEIFEVLDNIFKKFNKRNHK